MNQVKLLARAEWDLEDLQDYFEAQQIGLGIDFVRAFRQGIERIAQFPRRYAKHWGAIRICPLRPFKVGVFYRVENGVAFVMRVLDLRRKPRQLRRQLGI